MSDVKSMSILAGCLGLACVISLGANYYQYNERASIQQELSVAIEKNNQKPPVMRPERPAKKLVGSGEGGNAAEVQELNEYINQLQDQIAQLKSQNQNGNPEEGMRRGGRGERGENFQERMERMKEEEPERYEAMMQRREEFQKKMEDRMTSRVNFFKNLDTSKLSAAQRSTISDYQDMLAQNQEMMNSMANGERPDFRQAGELMRNMNEMTTEVQDILFSQLGGNVASSVREILDATSNGFGGPGMGMGGGPGMGMGGGPGRGGRQ